MKKYLVLCWMLLPLPVLVLHFGRGQQWLARDQAHVMVTKAAQLEQAKDWHGADALYREAAKLAAGDDPQLRLRLDLAQVRTRHRMGEAVNAIDMAEKLLTEPALKDMPPEFRREAREVAGRIHYHAAWVMRLEGASRELWMEQAEQARQNFRMLAETTAGESPPAEATRLQENLESAVQLQRLSLTELMARPLPEEGQCMGGQGLSEQMGKRRGQRGNQPGQGQQEGPPDKGAGMDRYKPGQGS
ncbi:MAG: hypothetical protein MUF04_00865 [Akkermansiaceae bacterium]|jgi:hypothetical protein|nr:hypothetical protein [Akkermansiaceae bacterium]